MFVEIDNQHQKTHFKVILVVFYFRCMSSNRIARPNIGTFSIIIEFSNVVGRTNWTHLEFYSLKVEKSIFWPFVYGSHIQWSFLFVSSEATLYIVWFWMEKKTTRWFSMKKNRIRTENAFYFATEDIILRYSSYWIDLDLPRELACVHDFSMLQTIQAFFGIFRHFSALFHTFSLRFACSNFSKWKKNCTSLQLLCSNDSIICLADILHCGCSMFSFWKNSTGFGWKNFRLGWNW